MRNTLCRRWPWLLAVGFCLALALPLSSAAPLTVPKAAEHANDQVTFGEAVGAPPSPAARMVPPRKVVPPPPPKAADKPVARKASGSARPGPAGKSPAKATPTRKAAGKPRPKAARK
ncbi:MAG: hypothetical protein V5B36_05795 [Candidatus Accumulibacter sp. UW25]